MIKKIKRLIPKTFVRNIYRIIIKAKYRNVHFGKKARADLGSVFGGWNSIKDYASVSKSVIGYGSYISGQTRLRRVKIGKYCSIGQNVRNSFGIHPTDFVSTHPAFYSTKKQAGFSYVSMEHIEEHKYLNNEGSYLNIIGNDVWIGNNVLLMDGITIGDGAIVGAGAVVTRNVEPYSIVGGVPAKKIRMRFSHENILILQAFKWWDKEEKWIRNNADSFTDISSFLKLIKEE